ncbi:SagB/ThcOx family dehydrogenase [Nocardia sp. NPDC058499]|uniref:SagB/ThcOx family dehydrogenase n=1 Tax=Nocardia sp. NPDC058499 TaxID=3346530 RepID=UPI003662B2D9
MTEHVVPLGTSGKQSPLRTLLWRRRSTRSFSARSLSLDALASILWAAQGHTADGHRVCPSAHARYPLALSIVAGDVDGLAAGVYTYDAESGHLRLTALGDHRDAVAQTALVDHEWLKQSAALLVLTGDIDSANRHFADQPPAGRRGQRYVWLEAGHASQNIYLQATETGLGATLVAGFHDDRLQDLDPTVVPAEHEPLAILAVGLPSEDSAWSPRKRSGQ